MSIEQAQMQRFLSGEALYGDDLSDYAIRSWFESETNAYYDLTESYSSPYQYSYHALNRFHFFKHLTGRFNTCLAIGCARGDDVLPIAPRVERFIAVEPAEKWWSDHIGETPARYIKPRLDGKLPGISADLAVCCDVLHHIPNVTRVLTGIAGALTDGALFLLREPVTSMGDWRYPRPGLTKNERGLPLPWLERLLPDLGFRIVRRRFCMFPLTTRIAKALRIVPYNSDTLVRLDAVLSAATSHNYHYHRDSILKKLAPSAVCYILAKTIRDR